MMSTVPPVEPPEQAQVAVPEAHAVDERDEHQKRAGSIRRLSNGFNQTFHQAVELAKTVLSPKIVPQQHPGHFTAEGEVPQEFCLVHDMNEYAECLAHGLAAEVHEEAELLATQTALVNAQAELEQTLHKLEMAKANSEHANTHSG